VQLLALLLAFFVLSHATNRQFCISADVLGAPGTGSCEDETTNSTYVAVCCFVVIVVLGLCLTISPCAQVQPMGSSYLASEQNKKCVCVVCSY
jgi:hypothetical protein